MWVLTHKITIDRNTMKTVPRNELPDDYSEMMKTEQHHNHEIIEDDKGVLRWKEDPFIGRFVDACSLNDIVCGFRAKGNGKNSEIYREFYRKMGYSLSGYWGVFYWEANNEEAGEYQPQQK